MELKEFFDQNPAVAVAFSGGCDSAYLLYSAARYCEKTCAYYVHSQFQPQFEMDDAARMCRHLRVDMKVIDIDILTDPHISENPADRCYYCKHRIFESIIEAAHADGFEVVVDGTNASDREDDRPGMVAIRELGIVSPLRECGLTKPSIRRRSSEAGLFTCNKPSYACLATRIPTGVPITEEHLKRSEHAETFLTELGFNDFRVRSVFSEGDVPAARIVIEPEQSELLKENYDTIRNELLKTYSDVITDQEVR